MIDLNLFKGSYKGKKVFITGTTGFKGSWLAYWLTQMGAQVCGYALEPPTKPSHFEQLGLKINQVIGDIRDQAKLEKAMQDFGPDIVFHLAAQALVKLSYKDPVQTFETNVIGTLLVYEACRKTPSVRSIVSITTDKVYKNNEWAWGYREIDSLGGNDPYSASKAANEIMSYSYRFSYFNPERLGKDHDVLLAIVRAGNVIGGGDWALDRLIPDIVKTSVNGEEVAIRSPGATRPWQHVLEPLSGYLLVGQNLIERKVNVADSYNFGPIDSKDMTVEEVVVTLRKYWDKIDYKIERPKEDLHEAGLLKLDCTKASKELDWYPVWSYEKSLKQTILWYKSYYEESKVGTHNDLMLYVKDAQAQGLTWTK